MQQCEDEDEDDEMEYDEDDDAASKSSTPVTTTTSQPRSTVSLPSISELTTTTSASFPFAGTGRHYSISSASQASFSPYLHSNQTSPSFGPQLSHVSSMPASVALHRDTIGIGSPALGAMDSATLTRNGTDERSEVGENERPISSTTGRSEHELDREATAALLMLNNDRRNWRSSQTSDGGRFNNGMSVRDLLSG